MKIAAILGTLALCWKMQAALIPILIVDGQNNQDYKSTTRHIKSALEEPDLFPVALALTQGIGSIFMFKRP